MVTARSRLARLVRVYGRGLVAVVAFAVVLAFPTDLRLELQILAAWNAYAVVWLALTWAHALRPSTAGASRWDLGDDRRRWRLTDGDAGRETSLVSVVATGVFGLAFALVLAFQLERPAAPGGSVLVALATLAVLTAWLMLHTAYARYYAYLHYRGRGEELTFPGETEPNYLDFAYFAFTLGVSFAASDVSVVGRRMRATVLGHTLLSFVYNTGVLGLVVNLALIARL